MIDFGTATGDEVAAAMRPGVIAALRAHKAAGVPIVIWDRETQTTVLVPPEEIDDYPDVVVVLHRPELIPTGRPKSNPEPPTALP